MTATPKKPGPTPRGPRERLSPEVITGLVDGAGAGDQRAWDRLVQEFGSLIWAIARAHRLGDADAADVSQATWLALLRHIEKLNNPAGVGAWIATTARRECLRVLRGGQRSVLFGDDCPEHESPDPEPGHALLIAERDDALRRAFSRLRAADQALLRLLTADPAPSYDEIAAALDMPIGSIGPTRQRALTRLREQLDGEQTLNLMID
ncbi:MAG TPA: sigma-70 family RNA polymerase sigma factor [Solirubrobacteraceae bacterium]|nr:sigma-70 family RNA polymerase sigma factor [Solirubrobacteraceae bacterium]